MGITKVSAALANLDGAVVINESSADVDFRVESNGNANMLFVDGGNDRVGIGTASPTGVLTSYKSTNGDPVLGHFYNDNAGTATEATVYVTNSSTLSDGLFLQTVGSSFTTTGGFVQDGVVIGSGTGASGGLSLMTRASSDMRFYTNGHTNERMRIDSSGNIGINTSSPSAWLEVKDDGSLAQDMVLIQGGGASGAYKALQIKSNSGDDIFHVNALTYDTCLVHGSAALGIGTASPSAKVEISTTDNLDTLMLTSTDADANVGPNLVLYRNSASPADGDMIGMIHYDGENSAGETISYAKTYAETYDITDGTEDGRYVITTMVGGSESVRMYMNFNETVFNESSADVDFRVESDNNTHMLFVDAANDRVGIGTASPNNKLHVYKGDSGHSWSFDTGDVLIVENSDSASLNIATPNSNSGNILFSDAGERGRGRIVYDHSSDYMAFATSGQSSERMRIDSSGDIFFGGTSVTDNGSATVSPSEDDGAPVLRFNRANTTATSDVVRFINGGSTVGFIAYNNSSTTYSTSSDYRLKDIKGSIQNGLERTLALNPVEFEWKETGKTSEGFIAHEAQEIFTDAVTGEKDGEKMQGMDYGRITPLLVKAIQEQQEQIEELKQQINELRGN